MRRTISKPLLFGFYGAIGCLIAALLFGETLLYFTRLPPTLEKTPQEIVLLIDCSGSMDGNKLSEVKTAATSFVQRQDLITNRIAVMGFGSGVQLGTPLTSDVNVLQTAIANLYDGGGTMMDQALTAATDQLHNASASLESAIPSGENQHILLFTDGVAADPYNTLVAGQTAQNAQINIVAVATGDADTNFLSQLTGDPNLVFYANTGNFDAAFQAAEKAIYSKQLVESNASGNYGLVLGSLRIGGWTGLLALGTSLALIIGQNHYLHRRLLSFSELSLGITGGFLAGLIAGSSGQVIYTPVSEIPLLSLVGRVVGWTILGLLVGSGMSLFVPNLKLNRALIGGGMGGIAGAGGFLVATDYFGEIPARLIGAAILGFFIGLMIALIEQISSQARLIVHWSPKEQTSITLGEQPVILGSSNKAHVHLSQAQGFYPTTAKIYQEGASIIMQYDNEYGQAKGMKKLRHELKNGDRRQFGQLTLEIQIK
ncbi:vWA domain-containing protein [Gloeothece verrucosa]|nr:vWA domain-containing protein [Gloeothece verrucosa]